MFEPFLVYFDIILFFHTMLPRTTHNAHSEAVTLEQDGPFLCSTARGGPEVCWGVVGPPRLLVRATHSSLTCCQLLWPLDSFLQDSSLALSPSVYVAGWASPRCFTVLAIKEAASAEPFYPGAGCSSS